MAIHRFFKGLPMGRSFWILWSTVLIFPGLVFAADVTSPIRRNPWTSSRVVGSPEPPSPYRAVKVYENLKIEQPVYAAPEPGSRNLFVVELQRGKELGRIHRVADRADVSAFETLFTTDRLIYGIAFHPRYQENQSVFLYSNGGEDKDHKVNRISRITIPKVAGTPVDPAGELVILEWESNGHNGGEPAFGPDGYLYAATGDGTSDSDPLQTGQGVNDLLAVMLRIDVDHPSADKPYSIPADNPFLGLPDARGEIWAFGFRNPWRTTFDRKTGQLWVTQNGQDLWEQVYLVRRGENYGWSVQEGGHPFYPNRPRGPGEIVPPVADHHHTEARSLTGGVVYYGSKLPELQGAYIYGDYSTGRIWGLRHNGARVTWHQELVDTPLSIVGFVETPGGELAVIDQHTGFYRLEPSPPPIDLPPFPTRLSETGLFASVNEHSMAEGIVPYSVNSPLWSDGAHKERFLAIPGAEQIEFTPSRPWKFPEATVLVKTFSLEMEAGKAESRRRIETRLLTLQQKEWIGYTYAWNAEQTDAVLVEKGGRDETFTIRDAAAETGERQQVWHYPSRSECMVCHSRAAGFVLGLQTEQMNRQQEYPSGPAQQLEKLAELGMFHKPLPKPATEYAAFSDPHDATQPLEQRVRSYLHVNCSTCHQWAGGGNSQFDVQHSTELAKTMLVDAPVLHDRFGIENAKLVAPGDPARSMLLQRVLKRGRGQMPPLATSVVDQPGAELIEAWIRQLTPDAKNVAQSDR
ncbi:MAG: PQQ-dependent sugar dehydrogenase [Planctomycetaceae bacterium]|nr:PQQ-dependent sugar dehydrogenase [Planctomycetaceae bacterium]